MQSQSVSDPTTPTSHVADGARAVEVAALLDDSVVAVHHLRPGSGRVTGTTWAMFASAAFALLVAVSSFAHAVGVAARNDENLKTWIAEEKALIDFVPERLSPAWDALALLGLLSGLGLIAWGMARVPGERRSPWFRIGRGPDAEFPTDEEPFALVSPRGDGFVFRHRFGMKGEVFRDGTSTSLSSLPAEAEVPIVAGSKIRVSAGARTFLITPMTPPRGAVGTLLRFDAAALACAAVSVGAHGLALILLMLAPASGHGYSSDDLDADYRATRINMKPQEEARIETGPQGGQTSDKAGQDAAMSGQKGTAGKADMPDSTSQKGRMAAKKVDDKPVQFAHDRVEKARSAGVLAVLKARGDVIASMTSTGDFTVGFDDRDIVGALTGDEIGERAGTWGYAPDGFGPGGGNPRPGIIGTGRYDTIPGGTPTGPRSWVPGSVHGLPPHKNPGLVVHIGHVDTPPDVDKNMIRRYVRQKLAVIEYCYTRELQVNPTLSGTITAQFTIDANGRVITASARGMGAPGVESCVADAIRTIEFPKGNLINVTSYPFVFHPAGA